MYLEIVENSKMAQQGIQESFINSHQETTYPYRMSTKIHLWNTKTHTPPHAKDYKQHNENIFLRKVSIEYANP
jgi:hypothetical protein